jgi:hypothetical protein
LTGSICVPNGRGFTPARRGRDIGEFRISNSAHQLRYQILWGPRVVENATDAAVGAAEERSATISEIPGIENTINHIFGNEAHNLSSLVEQFGSREGAFEALYYATDAAVRTQGITGIFETVVDVGGQFVTVRGNVLDEVLRVTTAFIP